MNGPADWMAAQQHLWRLWQSALAGVQGTNSSPPFGPDSVAAFWQPFLTTTNPAGPADLFKSLFFPWTGGPPEEAATHGFTGWLNEMLEGLQRAAADSAEGAAPADFVSRLFQAPLVGVGGIGGRGPDPFGAAAWMNTKPSEFARLFDLPPLGVTREWEEKWRELQRAAKAEFEAAQALGRQNARIYYAALKKFSRSVRGDDSGGEDITTLRGLYDLWIDIAEAAYRKRVMTPAYGQAFGRYINSGARSRKAWQTLVSDSQEALNLPNRREIDSLIKQQAALAARLRELEQERTAFDIDTLVARVSALDTRLDALSTKPPESPKPAPTGEKARRSPKKMPRAAKLPTRRSGPAKAETARPKKRAKAKRGSAAPAAEFDIGNLGSLS